VGEYTILVCNHYPGKLSLAFLPWEVSMIIGKSWVYIGRLFDALALYPQSHTCNVSCLADE